MKRALRNCPRSASASISRLLSQRLRNLSAWLLLTTLTFPTPRCLFYIPAIAGLQCWRVCTAKFIQRHLRGAPTVLARYREDRAQMHNLKCWFRFEDEAWELAIDTKNDDR